MPGSETSPLTGIDLIDYGGLKPKFDDDIRREAVLL